MKYLLIVCQIAATAAVLSPIPICAQTPPLQKGVSVQMAVTNNATPMPEADKPDAWIIAVTAAGQIYFGTQPVNPERLAEKMKAIPRNRDAKLYVKADARANYGVVKKTLQAGKEVMFDGAVLLTKQPESPALGMMVPPKGLEVSLAGSSSEPVVVRILNSGQGAPELKVNDNAVSMTGLQTALNQAMQNRAAKRLVINPDAELSFAEVAHVIDAARSVGATVIMAVAEM